MCRRGIGRQPQSMLKCIERIGEILLSRVYDSQQILRFHTRGRKRKLLLDEILRLLELPLLKNLFRLL